MSECECVGLSGSGFLCLNEHVWVCQCVGMPQCVYVGLSGSERVCLGM